MPQIQERDGSGRIVKAAEQSTRKIAMPPDAPAQSVVESVVSEKPITADLPAAEQAAIDFALETLAGVINDIHATNPNRAPIKFLTKDRWRNQILAAFERIRPLGTAAKRRASAA